MSLLKLSDNTITIFTDGSSRGNPGPGGYAAVAIYPNAYGEFQVDEIGGREQLTTNNRMELKAVIEGIKNFINYYQDLSQYSFILYVDSSYVVNGASKWRHSWKRNGWMSGPVGKAGGKKEEVKNQDLWKELDALLENSAPGKGGVSKPLNVKWNLIEGHAGVVGNERCDVIATMFADLKPLGFGLATIQPELFTGPLATYISEVPGTENILDITAVDQAKKDALKARKSSSKKGASSAKAYSYVSMVDGAFYTDKTWKECESRVKGKSGARFKKSFSAADEAAIKAEFKKGKK